MVARRGRNNGGTGMGGFGRFGILAHSAEGAALCFLTFCREGFREIGPHLHPDVMMDCEAMGHILPAWDAGDFAGVRSFLARSIQRLADGGCDFFACPDNTAPISLELPGPEFPLPGLNIGDIVAERAQSLGMSRVAVLGTRFTMSGSVYRRALPAVGIEPAFPNDAERSDIDRIIFDELVEGKFTE